MQQKKIMHVHNPLVTRTGFEPVHVALRGL